MLLKLAKTSGCAALLLSLAMHAWSAVPEPSRPPSIEKQILVLPTLQWDSDGERWRFSAEQNELEVERALDGMDFGMSPAQVNRLMPHPAASLDFESMPVAPEFPEAVHYTWLHMAFGGKLVSSVKSCFGASSYIVVLFRASGLFRISYRFLPDAACRDPRPAAEEVYAKFLAIDSTLAFAVHYHTGFAEVVDVSDPHAGILLSQRWLMPGQ